MLGQIIDDSQKGMRIRKGNILIGDGAFTRVFFEGSNERFYAYVQGEVFIFDDEIIPNARRDSFESSKAFERFKSFMKPLFAEIAREIRDKSSQRNNPHTRQIQKIEEDIKDVSKGIREGFTSETELEEAEQKVTDATDTLDELSNKVDNLRKQPVKDAIKTKIEELKEDVQAAITALESDAFLKVAKVKIRLSGREKELLLEIFEELYQRLEKDQAHGVIDSIIERLNNIGKTT
jgi:molecular chaperone HtpG